MVRPNKANKGKARGRGDERTKKLMIQEKECEGNVIKGEVRERRER